MSSLKRAALAVMLGLFALSCHAVTADEELMRSLKNTARPGSLREISAENWNIIGNNLVVKGNVHVPMGDLDIYADQAVVDMDSRSFTVQGNIQVYRKAKTSLLLEPGEIARAENLPGVTTRLVSLSTDIFGVQKITVEATYVNGTIKADSLSGNLTTGFFEFSKAEMEFNSFVCRAERGERRSNGIIVVKDAEMSTCSYLASRNAHYSISCGEAYITPYDTDSFGLDNLNTDAGDYTFFAVNCVGRIYGVPVIWLPMLYKPRDEKFGLPQMQWGSSGDYGFFLSISKKYHLFDYPNTTIRLFGDFYERRGFGYGARVRASTDNSWTDIFGYGIYDSNPYRTDKYYRYGIEVPHQRYDFRISNVTHISPTLDFRGHFEVMSDPYINRDFFRDYYSANPEPVTFASLEKQFDHFSAAIYVRPRVNDFFNAVERLPEGRIDIYRQEILNTNIYYQGEISMAYLRRKWMEYDKRGFSADTKAYSAGRFDNLNMFYYPLRLDWLTIVPRAGFRMTAYTDSSKTKIHERDLAQMLVVNDIGYESLRAAGTRSYDDKGGSRFRFVAEFGVEASTKIYNSWQDVRSAFFELDGLRHMIQPYVNYNFIPRPSEERKHLYYFDDIDRITEQHFVRLGIINRLQTRRDDAIVDYFTMENYWDYHFIRRDGFNNVGDFCTRLTVRPFKGLHISTMFSIAVGDSDDLYGLDRDVYRNGRKAGHPGLYARWLNRWEFNLTYEPVRDYLFTLRYNYQNRYRSAPAYSMGSSLSELNAGSAFEKFYTSQTQQLSFGVSFPLTPDRRTRGYYSMYYDFNAGFAPNHRFAVTHQLHCWELAAELNIETEHKDRGGKEHDISFYITARLNGLSSPLEQTQNNLLASARERYQFSGKTF